MPVLPRQVYETTDGERFDTEKEARDHELVLELRPLISRFLEEQNPPERVRLQQVGDLILMFAVQLLAPPPPPEGEAPDE